MSGEDKPIRIQTAVKNAFKVNGLGSMKIRVRFGYVVSTVVG